MLSFPATADLPVIPGTLDAEGRGVVHVPWAPTSWTIGRPACLDALACVVVCAGRMRVTPVVDNDWRVLPLGYGPAAVRYARYGVFDIPAGMDAPVRLQRRRDGAVLDLVLRWDRSGHVSWRFVGEVRAAA